MSLTEFAEKHTMAEIHEIAVLQDVQRNEKERDERIRRVEQQAKANRSKA